MVYDSTEIQHELRSHRVVVYSKTSCPHSRAGKEILRSLSQGYVAVELDHVDRAEDGVGRPTALVVVAEVVVTVAFDTARLLWTMGGPDNGRTGAALALAGGRTGAAAAPPPSHDHGAAARGARSKL